MSDEPASSRLLSKVDDPRVYFAAERTFLAWIRTGLALMGFGFVVAKFGLFLREFAQQQSQAASHSTGTSLWLGTGLVILGVVVDISAVSNHIRQVKALHSGTWVAGRPSKTTVTVGLCWLRRVLDWQSIWCWCADARAATISARSADILKLDRIHAHRITQTAELR